MIQLQSNSLNKERALLYTIWKYFFKEYFEFGSVSLFWIGQKIFVLGSIRFNRESIDSRFLQPASTGNLPRDIHMESNNMLSRVYQDWVHQNPDTHLDGGIE